ncbi:MAG: alpha/beta hydrolase [Ectothiorhodospiraceae bacterium]
MTGERSRRRRWLLWVSPIAVLVLAVVAWTWWAEEHPEDERELRVRVHELLDEQFPEQMRLPASQVGLEPLTGDTAGSPDVILVHGLDEPGGIWDDLAPALRGAGLNPWAFRYPNDQAINRSANLLAQRWHELPADKPVVLIGHSMGGLVIRDFVSRHRHPVDGVHGARGAGVRGVILVAPPNRGSPWARLRVWLELREFLARLGEADFTPFAALQGGTGAAKVDLRPGSAFLERLNQRPWPARVPVRIIGGRLAQGAPDLPQRMEDLAEQAGVDGVSDDLLANLKAAGAGLGDGVVPVSSLPLPEAPPPLLLDASHRGLLLSDNGAPPAIEPILGILRQWRVPETPTAQDS